MQEYSLGAIETRFAELIWKNEPVSSGRQVQLCQILQRPVRGAEKYKIDAALTLRCGENSIVLFSPVASISPCPHVRHHVQAAAPSVDTAWLYSSYASFPSRNEQQGTDTTIHQQALIA